MNQPSEAGVGTPAPARMSFQFWAIWFLSLEVYLLYCTCNADSSNLFVERPSPRLLRDLFFALEPRELLVGSFVFDPPGAPEPWLLLLLLLVLLLLLLSLLLLLLLLGRVDKVGESWEQRFL